MKHTSSTPDTAIQALVCHTLRIGVGLALAVCLAGGSVYLVRHGGEALPDYTQFSYTDPAFHPAESTTLPGICGGVLAGSGRSLIQLGVLVLILTPVVRVLLSLLGYLRQRDWLYAAITAAVLAVILFNSFPA